MAAQLQDQRCKDIIELLYKTPEMPDERLVNKEYCLKNGRLYRNTTKGSKWVIPKTARRRLLLYYHDEASHFGVDKILESLSHHYWFPSRDNMYEIIYRRA